MTLVATLIFPPTIKPQSSRQFHRLTLYVIGLPHTSTFYILQDRTDLLCYYLCTCSFLVTLEAQQQPETVQYVQQHLHYQLQVIIMNICILARKVFDFINTKYQIYVHLIFYFTVLLLTYCFGDDVPENVRCPVAHN